MNCGAARILGAVTLLAGISLGCEAAALESADRACAEEPGAALMEPLSAPLSGGGGFPFFAAGVLALLYGFGRVHRNSPG